MFSTIIEYGMAAIGIIIVVFVVGLFLYLLKKFFALIAKVTGIIIVVGIAALFLQGMFA
jgi:presenilin-like A22 family membrane protease